MPSLEALAEALSAAEGGAVSTAVLYPLEVIKTVIQAQQKTGKSGKQARKQPGEGGGSSTYANRQGEEQTTTGGTEETDAEQAGGEQQQEQQQQAGEGPSVAAALRAVTPASYASAVEEEEEEGDEEGGVGEGELTVWSVAEEIWRRRGAAGFFEGVEYAALQSAIEKAVYFYAYSVMRGITKLLTGGAFSLRANLVVGYLSEVVHLPLTVPLEVVITRLITSKGRLTSFVQAFQEAVKEGGLPSLYKGITAYPVLCLKPAIQYTVFEQLRKAILTLLTRRNGGVPIKSLNAAQAFLLGALSRAVATVVLFPWIRVRKQIMAQRGGMTKSAPTATNTTTTEGAASSENQQQPLLHTTKAATATAESSVMAALRRTYEDEGFQALFRGMGPELARGVLSAALMLMLKERLYAMNRTLLLRQRGAGPYTHA